MPIAPGSRIRPDPDRASALLAWFETAQRRLPWRESSDPYSILVSEVMLQQTQVSRVVAHYHRWIDRYPTVEALAEAPLGDVLALWQGLGYPVRARRLREAAATVVEHGWPPDARSLLSLPGVGPYTAAAVASIAFGEPVAAVDTNVRRVLGRWVGRPLDGPGVDHEATEHLTGDAGTWNQAVMELGAVVCRPSPRCEECPVARWCEDPSVYVPPAGQSRFEGSHRQVRGAVLRGLTDGRASTPGEIAGETGYSRDQIDRAVHSLIDDGLLDSDGTTITPAP